MKLNQNAGELSPATEIDNNTELQTSADTLKTEPGNSNTTNNATSVVPLATDTTQPTAPAEGAVAPSKQRRKRGADPTYDNIWTRHHAICLLGVICDTALGGLEARRLAPTSLEQGMKPKDAAIALLNVCPWLLNITYLNFQGSHDLETFGLERCFYQWAANRVYYFYRYPECNEHPANRIKGNLRLVYTDFCATFADEVSALLVISEERAKAFWLSVKDRVPFRLPLTNDAQPLMFLSEGGIK